VGKLLSGGRYQADNGLVYSDYQSAVNAGQVGQALQKAGSGLLWGLTHPVELANKYEAARRGGFNIGRSANAGQIGPSTSLLTQGDPTGRYAPVSMQTSDYSAWRGGSAPAATALPGARAVTPTTSPNTRFEAADEEYNRLLSQYGGAPGISQLAGMSSLPTGFTPTGATKQANLKDYYAAQALQGSANLGTIIKDMGYTGDMAKWAQLHPGLAQEQYAKKFGAGSAGGRDIGSFIGDVSRYADQGQASPAGQTSFGQIANPVAPTQALNQGAMVDANRGKENLLPQQAAKTTPEGAMPQLETTAQPQTILDKATTFVKALFPAGVGQVFGPRY